MESKKDLDLLVENFFKPKKKKTLLNLGALLEMVEQAMDVDAPLLQEEASPREGITLSWDGIPELQLTELAWGAAAADGENPSDARVQLERFLEQIGIGRTKDFAGKLRALSSFYSRTTTRDVARSADMEGAGIDLSDSKQTISRILGYLVFYKTLTRILQNFNASSAGFTFESFVAVLLGGEQIPTGNQTIADLTSGTGEPISLKLLSDDAPVVKGSIEDLIKDLAGLGSVPVEEMKYIVALKLLDGEGSDLVGEIKFFRFTFRFENLLDILSHTGGKYQENLRLPLGEDGISPDASRALTYVEPVPNYVGEVVDDDRRQWWEAHFEEVYDDVATAADISDAEDFKDAVFDAFDKETGEASSESRIQLVRDLMPEKSARAASHIKTLDLYRFAGRVSDTLRTRHKALIAAASKARSSAKASASVTKNYASAEDSVKYLRELQAAGDRKVFFDALLKTYGYVTRKQWLINKNGIETVARALGEKEPYIGRLFVGQSYVHEMVEMYGDIINEKVFSIFRELKVLTSSLQEFFGGGLKTDPANAAIAASNSIGEKTKKVEQEVGSD
jgi:hypothetical protein